MAKIARFSNTSGDILHDIQVMVFPSRRAFLRYCRSKHVTEGENVRQLSGRGCAAKMHGFAPKAADVGDPDAELVFYREQFTADCIAHEVFHALVLVFRKAGRDPLANMDDEELFASLQGMLTQVIIDWKAEEIR